MYSSRNVRFCEDQRRGSNIALFCFFFFTQYSIDVKTMGLFTFSRERKIERYTLQRLSDDSARQIERI